MSRLPPPEPLNGPALIPPNQPTIVEVSTTPVAGSVQHEEVHTADPTGIERHERVVRDPAGLEHREESVYNRGAERVLVLSKVEQLVWLVVGCIEALIAIRFVLRLIGANPENSFAQFIYSASALFVGPFYTLTASPSTGQVVFEISSLIAMLVYAVAGWALIRIIWLLLAPTTARAQSTYDRYRA